MFLFLQTFVFWKGFNLWTKKQKSQIKCNTFDWSVCGWICYQMWKRVFAVIGTGRGYEIWNQKEGDMLQVSGGKLTDVKAEQK